MASDWIQEIPWSKIMPDAQNIINYHLSKQSGKVIFEFAREKAWPIGCLAVVTGMITTGVRTRLYL